MWYPQELNSGRALPVLTSSGDPWNRTTPGEPFTERPGPCRSLRKADPFGIRPIPQGYLWANLLIAEAAIPPSGGAQLSPGRDGSTHAQVHRSVLKGSPIRPATLPQHGREHPDSPFMFPVSVEANPPVIIPPEIKGGPASRAGNTVPRLGCASRAVQDQYRLDPFPCQRSIPQIGNFLILPSGCLSGPVRRPCGERRRCRIPRPAKP